MGRPAGAGPLSVRPLAHGLLLAAGAGTRMGRPKALLHDADGTSWLRRSVEVLRQGGCPSLTVVLGAAADEARQLLDHDTDVVVAEDWATGMGASLRAGLAHLDVGGTSPATAVLVHLVDLPDVTAEVVRRVLAAGTGPEALGRAAYHGVPGHPVLLGRDHWSAVAARASGDRGARDHLAEHPPILVECGDLAGGADVDRRRDRPGTDG